MVNAIRAGQGHDVLRAGGDYFARAAFHYAAQFESWTMPLVLMLSIPFSLAGAGPALLFSGAELDSGAVIGIVTLFGIVVNNGIVLYETSIEHIAAGMAVFSAVY